MLIYSRLVSQTGLMLFALARVPQQQSKLIKLSCFHVWLSPLFDVLFSILA